MKVFPQNWHNLLNSCPIGLILHRNLTLINLTIDPPPKRGWDSLVDVDPTFLTIIIVLLI